MRKGFSLMEISIVLVIIGLITGGIVVGKDMIRASELRSVLTDVDGFKTAVSAFRTTYGGWPGDLKNASSNWAGANDGNGDGRIDYFNGDAGEEYVAWQHLSLAKLIQGDYTGVVNSIPKSRLTNAYYRMSYQGALPKPIYKTTGNLISLNSISQTTGKANGPVLSPRDLHALDVKADDGLADSGYILGFNESSDLTLGCVDHYYSFGSGTYIVNSDSIKCKVFFVISSD